MTSPTYDVSIPGEQWCNQEVVGEFAYKKNLKKLIRDLSIKERDEAFFTAELIPEPDNPYSSNGHAISVRWKNQVLGYLPEEDSGRYQQLRRIVASGFTPVAHARLWFYTDVDGDKNHYLRLSLREPEQLAPLNDPPREGWTLLPEGTSSQVTKESDHLDVLLDYVPPSGFGQLLVTLHLFQAGVRTKYEAVEVRLDGERIGELSKQTGGKYALAVRHFNDIGLTVVSRATIKGSSLSAEVTLHSAKSHELSEEDLEPKISPLPRLVPYCDHADEYDVPDAYTGHSIPVPKKKSPVRDDGCDDATSDDTQAKKEPTPPLTSNESRTPSSQNGPDKVAILLWVGVVFAGMCALTGLMLIAASVLASIGYVLIGAGIALACGWALRCRSQDKKKLAEWERKKSMDQQLDVYLTDEDRTLLSGMNDSQPPEKTPRNWSKIAPVAVVLIFAGFALFGVGAPEIPESTP